MASTAKVLIAAAVFERIDAGSWTLNTVLPFAATDDLEDGHNPSAAGNYTVRDYLGWMINESSTNATDRLVRALGAASINEFLEDSGIVDVGELTSICELDRRILMNEDPCAATLRCDVLEDWYRNDVDPPAGTPARTCTDSIGGVAAASFQDYYASLANSITPLQYARAWQGILGAEMMTPGSRDEFVDVLNDTPLGYMAGLQGTHFDRQGGKFGTKYEVRSYVGMGYDYVANLGIENDQAQFSFVLFTEDWTGATTAAASQTLMQDLADEAMTLLRNRC